MAHDPKSVVRRFVEEYQSHGKEEVAKELLADNFVDHSPSPGLPPNRTGVLMLFAAFRAGIPDLHAVIHEQLLDGDKVITRKTFHGTHTAELFGAKPTGNKIAVDVIDIVRVENGKMTEHWNVVNQLQMMQGIGLFPSAG